jgi:hypothetical protein
VLEIVFIIVPSGFGAFALECRLLRKRCKQHGKVRGCEIEAAAQ